MPLLVSGAEVKKILKMDDCINLMEKVFIALQKGQSIQPFRQAMWLPDKNGLLGTMPAFDGNSKMNGIKVVSVFLDNHAKGLSSHQGVVLLFESETGALISIQDAEEITAIRTAAVSGVATKILANPESETLAILGSGVQAGTHLEAITNVRPIKKVNIWSRNNGHAITFIEKHQNRFKVELKSYDDITEAVANADIICTTTSAREPLLDLDQVKPGVHINAVGACTPNVRELGADLVTRSKLFTDSIESLINEAGDFIIPSREGRFDETLIQAELGEVLTGVKEGRKDPHSITLFESLGIGVEDVACADFIFKSATALSLGTNITL
ncbi:MAG: ornithine cyclodeaminase family protein [Bacteroidetes bacterium]|nr:ornithine cyclodeaminase family protein [Bacteroidota bacterium]